MRLNGLLVGSFGFGDFALELEGVGQADGSSFVRRFEAESKLKLSSGFGVVSSAVVDDAKTNMPGRSGVTEFDGVVACALCRCNPLLLLGVRILEPVTFAQGSHGHAKVGIEFEGFTSH